MRLDDIRYQVIDFEVNDTMMKFFFS